MPDEEPVVENPIEEPVEDRAKTVEAAVAELLGVKEKYPKAWSTMVQRDFVHYFKRRNFTDEEQASIIDAIDVEPKHELSPLELPDPPKTVLASPEA